MNNLREVSSDNQWEIVKIKAVLTPFPVRFEFPDETRETIPKSIIKSIEGVRVLRFYCCPVSGDLVQFRGHLFIVQALHHEVQVRGSNKADKLPTVITRYLGAV